MNKHEYLVTIEKMNMCGSYATSLDGKKLLADNNYLVGIIQTNIDNQHSSYYDKKNSRYKGFKAITEVGRILYFNANDVNYIFITKYPRYCYSSGKSALAACWYQKIDFEEIIDPDFLLNWFYTILKLYYIDELDDRYNVYKQYFSQELWTQLKNKDESILIERAKKYAVKQKYDLKTINDITYKIYYRYGTSEDLLNFLDGVKNLKRLSSIFQQKNQDYWFYMLHMIDPFDRDTITLYYINISLCNYIVRESYHSDTRHTDFELITTWSGNPSICIEPEYLNEWLFDLQTVLTEQNYMKTKLCAVKYEDYIPQEMWSMPASGTMIPYLPDGKNMIQEMIFKINPNARKHKR